MLGSKSLDVVEKHIIEKQIEQAYEVLAGKAHQQWSSFICLLEMRFIQSAFQRRLQNLSNIYKECNLCRCCICLVNFVNCIQHLQNLQQNMQNLQNLQILLKIGKRR